MHGACVKLVWYGMVWFGLVDVCWCARGGSVEFALIYMLLRGINIKQISKQKYAHAVADPS